jgi:hypothetical protein
LPTTYYLPSIQPICHMKHYAVLFFNNYLSEYIHHVIAKEKDRLIM